MINIKDRYTLYERVRQSGICRVRNLVQGSYRCYLLYEQREFAKDEYSEHNHAHWIDKIESYYSAERLRMQNFGVSRNRRMLLVIRVVVRACLWGAK